MVIKRPSCSGDISLEIQMFTASLIGSFLEIYNAELNACTLKTEEYHWKECDEISLSNKFMKTL